MSSTETTTRAQVEKGLREALEKHRALNNSLDNLNLERESDRELLEELTREGMDMLHDLAYWSEELLNLDSAPPEESVTTKG